MLCTEVLFHIFFVLKACSQYSTLLIAQPDCLAYLTPTCHKERQIFLVCGSSWEVTKKSR